MNRFGLKSSLAIFALSLVGCATGTSGTSTTIYRQEASNAYCHKVLEPIGPTDPARTNQAKGDDFIDYYGPCDGPSSRDQVQKQKRFERFRFGRDYMDEG